MSGSRQGGQVRRQLCAVALGTMAGSIGLWAAIRARDPEPRFGARNRRLKKMVSEPMRSSALDTHVKI